MRIGRTAAVILAAALGAGWVLPPASATTATRNSFGAQCSHDSGAVRVWWNERGRGQLQGADTGAATDGSCATVPSSVPWFAQQVDGLLKTFRATGLPLPRSDAGVQRIAKELSDDGSGAYDILLSGGGSDYALAEASCAGLTYYGSGGRKYRTVAKMTVHNVPASVPSGDQAQLMRLALAHELVHFTQCAVTNASRSVSGSNLNGPWIEAVPQAFGLNLVGGDWEVGSCSNEGGILSASSTRDIAGYGQWPFWQTLLGTSGSTYVALLRDVIRVPANRRAAQLEKAVRARFSTAEINRAMREWAATAFFGGSKSAADGTPITWSPSDLGGLLAYLGDDSTDTVTPVFTDPLVGILTPATGDSASRAVTVTPYGCAALIVPWPDGAQTLTVTGSGLPGAVADSMAVGTNVTPSASPDASCVQFSTPTRVEPTANQFVVGRPCSMLGSRPPELWVVVVNGSATPARVTVTATAS